MDASPVGIGSIIMQNGRVIAYASKALSDVERRYSQSERETLSTKTDPELQTVIQCVRSGNWGKS